MARAVNAILAAYSPILRSAASVAIAFVFFANGFMTANWVVRIPAVKQDLALSDGTLGVTLLFFAAGGIIALPLGGALIARLGSKAVALAGGFGFCALFVLPGLAPSALMLALALFVVGFCNGAMDVGMNAQADAVEGAQGVRIMAFCHAMFSLGLALGTLPAGVFAAWDVDPALHLATLGIPLALAHLILGRVLVADRVPEGPPSPAFALPRGPLLVLGLICLCGAVAEGSMNDWIAVYVADTLGRAPLAAVAFGAFATAMLLGRLLGDVITDRLGSVLSVRIGMLLAASGVLFAMVGEPATFLPGFFLVGLGISGVFPAVFRAAGRVPGHAPGPSMAAAVTLGYGGFLLGPPVIGFVADATSLRLALGLLVPLLLAGALMAGALRTADGPTHGQR